MFVSRSGACWLRPLLTSQFLCSCFTFFLSCACSFFSFRCSASADVFWRSRVSAISDGTARYAIACQSTTMDNECRTSRSASSSLCVFSRRVWSVWSCLSSLASSYQKQFHEPSFCVGLRKFAVVSLRFLQFSVLSDRFRSFPIVSYCFPSFLIHLRRFYTLAENHIWYVFQFGFV